MCCVLCAVCCVLCAVCCVLCAVSIMVAILILSSVLSMKFYKLYHGMSLKQSDIITKIESLTI